MTKAVSITVIVSLLTLSACAVWLTHRIDAVSRKVEDLTVTTDRAANVTTDWMEFQLGEFRSPEYQKRIKQGFEVGRDASITIAKFNRVVIPELAETLRYARENNLVSLNDATLSFRSVLTDAGTLTRNTDHSLNGEGGILPNLALLATTFNTTTGDLTAAIKAALDEGVLTVKQAKKLLEDPSIPAILSELKGAAENLNKTADQVAKGFKEYPAMMTAWRKYSETANVWQKRLYFVRLLAIIAGIPGLL